MGRWGNNLRMVMDSPPALPGFLLWAVSQKGLRPVVGFILYDVNRFSKRIYALDARGEES